MPKKMEFSYDVLDRFALRYIAADNEYWDSMYVFEQYIQNTLCYDDKNSSVNIIDDNLEIYTKNPISEEFQKFIDKLKSHSADFEVEDKKLTDETYFIISIMELTDILKKEDSIHESISRLGIDE